MNPSVMVDLGEKMYITHQSVLKGNLHPYFQMFAMWGC